jgi:hypothetical protein
MLMVFGEGWRIRLISAHLEFEETLETCIQMQGLGTPLSHSGTASNESPDPEQAFQMLGFFAAQVRPDG